MTEKFSIGKGKESIGKTLRKAAALLGVAGVLSSSEIAQAKDKQPQPPISNSVEMAKQEKTPAIKLILSPEEMKTIGAYTNITESSAWAKGIANKAEEMKAQVKDKTEAMPYIQGVYSGFMRQFQNPSNLETVEKKTAPNGQEYMVRIGTPEDHLTIAASAQSVISDIAEIAAKFGIHPVNIGNEVDALQGVITRSQHAADTARKEGVKAKFQL